MKKKAIICTVVLSISLCLGGCRIGNTDFVLPQKEVSRSDVFCIDDSCCSKQEAMIYLCNYKNLYGNEYGIDLWKYSFEGESLEQYVKDVTLTELIRIKCMDALAKEQGLELSADEETKIKKISQQYYQSLGAKELAFMEVKESDIENAYRNYALAVKLYNGLTAGVNEEVSDDEARVIRVQQILVTDPKVAQTVEQKLQNEDFSAVAGTYNEAKTIEVTLARGEVPEELEKVAFNLADNEVSPMIKTDQGYYFVKCLNKYEEALTEQNKEVIRENREKQQFEQMYDSFVGNARYSLNTDMWEAIHFEDVLADIQTESFFTLYDEAFEQEKNKED